MGAKRLVIPDGPQEVVLRFGDREVRLTNLKKLFWKNLKLTKRHLLQYYADISPWLLPHIEGRAMVMKRYRNRARSGSTSARFRTTRASSTFRSYRTCRR